MSIPFDPATFYKTLGSATAVYVSVVFILRVSGKRTLSKWSSFDSLVTVALGSCVATGILSSSTSVVQAITGIVTLVILQLSLTKLSALFPKTQKAFKAAPVLLLAKGGLRREVLQRERIAEREIWAALRGEGISSMSKVDAVVLETNGELSVIEHLDEDDYAALSDVEGVELLKYARV